MKTLSLKWRLTLMTSALIVLVSVALNLLVSSSGLSSLDSLETYILQFSDADMPVPSDDFEVELTDSQCALLSASFPKVTPPRGFSPRLAYHAAVALVWRHHLVSRALACRCAAPGGWKG